MLKEYKKILFSGNFYRIDVAEDMITRSSLTWDMKRRLIAFIRLVNTEGIDHVRELSKKKTAKSKSVLGTLTKEKFRSYIQRLEMLDINPVTLIYESELTCITNPIKLLANI